MKFRPLHDRVVVKRIDAEEKTAGGIIIPDTAKEKPSQGEIIAVGPGGRDESGKLIPIDLKVGDTLMLNATPDSLIELRAGVIPLTRGRMGRRNAHIAVRVEAPLTPNARQAVQRSL